MKSGKGFLVIMAVSIQCGFGQMVSATLKVTGLTCSLCSKGVDKSLGKLSFIQNLRTDINTQITEINFKSQAVVSIDEIVAKVEDAGFSIGQLNIKFYFGNPLIVSKDKFSYDGYEYIILNSHPGNLKGEIILTLVGKKYMTDAEFRKWKILLQPYQRTKEKFYFVHT